MYLKFTTSITVLLILQHQAVAMVTAHQLVDWEFVAFEERDGLLRSVEMSSTNECATDEQKSSAEILDGLFRELEEKSAKGELPTQPDLSTVWGNTLTNEDLHRRSSHKRRKSSKHKHSHKHKKRKKVRKPSQPATDNSSDEWIPAEQQKVGLEVLQDSEKCSGQQSCNPTEDEVVVKIDNSLCKLADKPNVTFEHKVVANFELSTPDCDMTVKPNAKTLQKDEESLEVYKCIDANIISAMDKSQQAPKSLHVNNEQVLFLPRVTCLDRRVFWRNSLTAQQDDVPLNSAMDNAIIEGSPGVIKDSLSIAVPISSAVVKECDSSRAIELRKEKTSEKDENMDKSAPVVSERTLTHKQVAKLKSKITCSSLKKSSKKHSAKQKTKLKKKNNLSIDQKLHGKSHDKKHKTKKKHSKSKAILSRSRMRSKSTSPRKSRSPSRSTSKRSRSRSPKTQHSGSKSRRFKSTMKRKSRSNSREKGKSRSNSREKRKRCTSPRRKSWARVRAKTVATILGEKIDKVKLLEIARKNAIAMMAEGKLPVPATLNLEKPMQEKVTPAAFNKASGKSVEELTDFCKLLAKKEKEEGELSAEDSTSKPYHSSDEEDKGVPFVHHHPFKLKEQPNIIMNIRNAVQIPIKTQAEKAAEGSKLRIQFPVSSGTQHRKKEWVHVSPKKTPEVVKEKAVVAKVEDVAVFQPLPAENAVNIGAIVSQRLKAVRKLMDNPHDVEALNQMYKSQQEMQNWAQSKQLPGQFTGTTDVQILTPEQLAGPAHLQAWVKKDQFNRAAPVQGGFGMYMLQKMGWKPGEGLGKNKEGTAEPIILDIKTDKKGLVSQGEIARKIVPLAKDLSGKHPVSALVEICNKRRWLPPEFILVHDSGPDHKKNFVFKARVNGQEFQPTIASLNKKHAKAQSATVCLQALGLVPRDLNKPL